MDELLKRLNRYTRNCLSERTDPDFADAVEEMKNTLMAFGANAYRYASIALEHEIEIGKLKSELVDCRMREENINITHVGDDLAKAYEQGYEDGKPKWIPVTERLPEKTNRRYWSDNVLVWDGVSEFIAQYGGFQNTWTANTRIHHWMPLPEPPKEETDG